MKSYKSRFKSVVLEYAKGDPMMYANSVSAKKHSKSLMSMDRKHQNLLRKDYIQSHPIVDNVAKSGQDKMVGGDTLGNLLDSYGMSFEANTIKGVGNSGIAIAMWVDANTNAPMAIVHKKDANRTFPQLANQ